MKTKTKVLIVVLVIVALLVTAAIIYWETHHGNRQLIDINHRFNYAIIQLPNGEVVEGSVSSWLDFTNSDVVQVTIGGRTYLTHYANVCLIHE